MLWIATAATGLMIAELFLRRERAIEKLLALLSRMELEVSYYALPFPDMIQKISREASETMPEFVSLCGEMLCKGCDFPMAWKESIRARSPLLSKKEREQLSDVGSQLSGCSESGVLKLLSFYSKSFSLSLEEARLSRKKYSRLFVLFGVFVGGIIFITLI